MTSDGAKQAAPARLEIDHVRKALLDRGATLGVGRVLSTARGVAARGGRWFAARACAAFVKEKLD